MKLNIIFMMIAILILAMSASSLAGDNTARRILIYPDISGSICPDLFKKALNCVADALVVNFFEFEAASISVRCFDNNISLIMLEEKHFVIPEYNDDLILPEIRREYGILGHNAKQVYDKTIAKYGEKIKNIIIDAADYIRNIEPRQANMTDITGLLDHLEELDSTDFAIVITDLQDENPETDIKLPIKNHDPQNRIIILYMPSQADLNDPRGLRKIYLERKLEVEKEHPQCLVLPFRFVSKNWKKLFNDGDNSGRIGNAETWGVNANNRTDDKLGGF